MGTNQYRITENSGYGSSWPWLTLLLIAGVAVWRFYSAAAAAVIALLGLIYLLTTQRRNKKRLGDYVELTERGIVFSESGQQSCIAFNEIKRIKQNRFLSSYLLETTVGNKKKLQPGDYENSQDLRRILKERFAYFKCDME